MGKLDVAKVSCPFENCEWEYENSITDQELHGTEYAQMRAERHFEREHCGKAKIRVVVEKEVIVHPDQELRQIVDRHHDKVSERDELAGYEVSHAYGELLEEAESVGKSDENANGGSDE